MYSAIRLLAREVERHVSRTALPHVGDRHDLRAAHLHTIDRPFASEPTTGAQRLEDSYGALTTAKIKRSRSKKGTSTTVVRHGRSVVIGDSYPADVYGSRVPAMVIDHAIDTARTTDLGADGITLARIATYAYNLPELIGGEFQSWSEVIPADVGALLDWNPAMHTTGQYYGPKQTLVKRGSRLRLPATRARKGETLAPATVTYHDGQSVTRLHAPGLTRDTRWSGHTLVHRAPTVHAQRTTRPVDGQLRLTGDYLSSLLTAAQVIDKGERWTWRTDDGQLAGALTRSKSGKLRVSVKGHALNVESRTAQGLAAHLAPAFA